MLVMFKVKNYTSFKEESILDMRATAYVQHPTHIVPVNDKMNLLKTMAIYGANASGKSNFISAMYFFEQYIFAQFINKTEGDEFDTFGQKSPIELEPFKLSETDHEASEFDIVFLHNGEQIQYGFECTSRKVLNEWYFINDKKVFERKGMVVEYGSKYNALLSAYKNIPEARLYMSVLDYFLDEQTKAKVLGNFVSFFAREYNVFLEFLFESSIKSFAGHVALSKKLFNDDPYRAKVERYLRLIDVGIKRLDIQTQIVINEVTGKKEEKQIVRTVHDVFDLNGQVVGEKLFDLRQESSGTLRFFTYIQSIIDMIDKGGVFIVDELSARLHPLLTKLIVDIFQASNNTNAQLIFTTHDISLLNNKQFRRDEIAFVDKNDQGASSLYALSDIRMRDDATFHKDYLQGKYGAIPIFDYEKLMDGE